MKKLLMLVITALSAAGVLAQKLDASKIPAAVKNSFEKTYPGITAKWEKENGNYEVNFKQNGNTMSAIIDNKGTILETETDIKTTDLPAASLFYLKEYYKGKTIREAAKISKSGGNITYEAEIGGVDVIFDSSGKFLKEEKGEKD